MRAQGQAKLGFYPLPPAEAKRLKNSTPQPIAKRVESFFASSGTFEAVRLHHCMVGVSACSVLRGC